MTMGQRIKQLRKQKGLTQEQLGKYIGVQKSAIRKYEKDEITNMKRSTISILCNLFNVTPSYLMCLDESKIFPKEDGEGSLITIPVIDVIKKDFNFLAPENWIGTINIEKKIIGNNNNFFAFYIRDDNMAPCFINGDLIVIEQTDDCDNNEIALVVIGKKEAVLKKVKRNNLGILLQSINPSCETLFFTYEEIKDIPIQIIGIVRQLKRVF